MNPIGGPSLGEGKSTMRPPGFNGEFYSSWKVKMKIFIQSFDYEVWNLIEDGPFTPIKTIENARIPKTREEWNDDDRRRMQLNAKAMNVFYCALDANEFSRISTCESGKEIWDTLQVAYEGTNQVKESKINLLVHEYELFQMKNDESISTMFTRFTEITNSLKSLGRSYSSSDLVRKLLRSLQPRERWQAKVTAIEEAKDLNKLKLDDLVGSLMTHEITMKIVPSEDKKGKNIVLKASINDDEDEESDETMDMIARKLKKLMRRKKPFDKKFNNGEPSSMELICYKCQKPGHIKPDCPLQVRNSKKKKKKAMVATWSDSDSSGGDYDSSDKETINLCLMTNEIEVTSPLLEHDSSYNELQDVFDELMDEFEKLGHKHKKLKKDFIICNNALSILKDENDSLKQSLLVNTSSTQNELEMINQILQEKVDSLNITLCKFVQGKENLDKLIGSQRSVYDKAGLGYKPLQNQKEFNDFFSKEKVEVEKKQKCISIYCHLRKKMIKVKQVWVKKEVILYTNTKGPKKAWVPKGVL